MQLKLTSAGKAGARSESWLDRVVDRIKPQPSAPKSPSPPPVDQTQWGRSVDAHKVNTLTVHDIGLIVFNETQSFTDSDRANDTINAAREKLAHTVMNGDERFGQHRPTTAPPVEPTAKALRDPRTRAAYESSLAAAREAYLNAGDPTGGAIHMKFLTNADRSNQKFDHKSSKTVPLKTQSGPFENSYVHGDVPKRQVYVNTYGQD
jgi:hypothetical protein